MSDKKWHKVYFRSSIENYGSAEVLATSQEEAERIFLDEWSKAEMKLNRFENIEILKDPQLELFKETLGNF